MTRKPDPIQFQLRRIVERGIGQSAEINPFWRDLFSDFERLLERGRPPSLSQIQTALGYASKPLPQGVASNRLLPSWPMLMEMVETGQLDDPNSAEALHAAHLHFLRRKGLLDAYISWADAEGLASDLATARLYWYAHRLQQQLESLGRVEPQVFLEVGSGSGRFSTLLFQRGFVGHYVMVDLPEMLLNAMITVRKRFPQADVAIDETPDFSRERPTFWFLETKAIERVPPRTVDVAINFNSFMEMDEGVRDFYIADFYRALRGGGLFYNCNRMQRKMTRLDGTRYVNSPLACPYRADDTILEWEPDEIQESTRSLQFKSPQASFSISRMHLTKI